MTSKPQESKAGLKKKGMEGLYRWASASQMLAMDPFLPGILGAWESAWPPTVCQVLTGTR